MIKDLEIVFFHEIGHYYSHRMNEILYDSEHPIEVLIEEVGQNSFLGKTNVRWALPPCERIPQQIASALYGCYFQQRFLENKDFSTCFDFKNEYTKGNKDAQSISNLLVNCGKSNVRPTLYPFFGEYFFELFSNHQLDPVFEIKFEDYLTRETNITYRADLTKLDDELKNTYAIHSADYKNFIARITNFLC